MYHLSVIDAASPADWRSRPYESYASQHARTGGGSEAVAFVYRRGIRLLLPPPAVGPVVDIGCGRGDLVGLQADGFDAAKPVEGTLR